MSSGTDDCKMNFTSSQYASDLLANFHGILESEIFCDIKLNVDGKVFKAHKIVLAAASTYFQAMFTSGLAEVDKDIVCIEGINYSIFSSLIRFIYSGTIELSTDCCQDILTAADMLGLDEVVYAACLFLEKNLHASNCIGIYQFSDTYSCWNLKKSAEKFIASNFLEASSSEEFLSVQKDVLIKFLHSEDLHIDDEYQVFSAAMNWISTDYVNRRKFIFEVLAPVRMPLISQLHLERYIMSCPDLSVKIALRKLVQDFKCDKRMPRNIKLRRDKPSLFQPRKSATKNIYVIGGYSREEGGRWSDSQSLCTVECFNTYHEQWKCIPPLQYSRSGHGAVILNGICYVIGGESDSLIYDNVECLDPTTNKWSLVTSLTTPRCGLGASVFEEMIFVFGGWVGSEIGRSVECFDPQVNAWTVTDQMKYPKFAMGVARHEGLIYVVGGMSDDGAEKECVESYNPITKEWNCLEPMHERRAYVGVAVLDNYLYAVGGWNESKGALLTVERYSFDKGAWSFVTPMSMPRAGSSVIAVNNSLYVLGGRICHSQFAVPSTVRVVECYNPQTDSWFSLGSMPYSCCEAAVVVL